MRPAQTQARIRGLQDLDPVSEKAAVRKPSLFPRKFGTKRTEGVVASQQTASSGVCRTVLDFHSSTHPFGPWTNVAMRFLVTLLALLSFEILLAGSARTAFAQGQSTPSNFQFEQFTSILAKTVSMSWRTPSSMQTLHSFPWQHHLCVSPCCSTLISNAHLHLQWSNVTSRDPSELRRLPSTLPQTPNLPLNTLSSPRVNQSIIISSSSSSVFYAYPLHLADCVHNHVYSSRPFPSPSLATGGHSYSAMLVPAHVLTTWRLRRSHISEPHAWGANSCQERRAKEFQRFVCPPVARGQNPTHRHGRCAVTLCLRHTPRYGVCRSLLPPTNAALSTHRPPPPAPRIILAPYSCRNAISCM